MRVRLRVRLRSRWARGHKMATEKLTAGDIRDAMPGRHGDGRGLWLEVDPPGGRDAPKRWVFRFMLQGHSREMGLGSLAD